jgi:hypothetical protein
LLVLDAKFAEMGICFIVEDDKRCIAFGTLRELGDEREGDEHIHWRVSGRKGKRESREKPRAMARHTYREGKIELDIVT